VLERDHVDLIIDSSIPFFHSIIARVARRTQQPLFGRARVVVLNHQHVRKNAPQPALGGGP
jgi:hypothetical protein